MSREQLLVAHLSSLLEAARRQCGPAPHANVSGTEQQWRQQEYPSSNAVALWQLAQLLQGGIASAGSPRQQQQQQQPPLSQQQQQQQPPLSQQQSINQGAAASLDMNAQHALPHHSPLSAPQLAGQQGPGEAQSDLKLLLSLLQHIETLSSGQGTASSSEARGPACPSSQPRLPTSLAPQPLFWGSHALQQQQQGGLHSGRLAPQWQLAGPGTAAVEAAPTSSDYGRQQPQQQPQQQQPQQQPQQQQHALGGEHLQLQWWLTSLLSDGLPLSQAEKLQLSAAAQQYVVSDSGAQRRASQLQAAAAHPSAGTLSTAAAFHQQQAASLSALAPMAPTPGASAGAALEAAAALKAPWLQGLSATPAGAISTLNASPGTASQQALLRALLFRAQQQQQQGRSFGNRTSNETGAVPAFNGTASDQNILVSTGRWQRQQQQQQHQGPSAQEQQQQQGPSAEQQQQQGPSAEQQQQQGPSAEQQQQQEPSAGQPLQQQLREEMEFPVRMTPESQGALKQLLLRRRQEMDKVFQDAGFTPPIGSERKPTPFSSSSPLISSLAAAPRATVSSLEDEAQLPAPATAAAAAASGGTTGGGGGRVAAPHHSPSLASDQQGQRGQQGQQRGSPLASPFDSAATDAVSASPWPAAVPLPAHHGSLATLSQAMGSSSVSYGEGLGPRPIRAQQQAAPALDPAGIDGSDAVAQQQQRGAAGPREEQRLKRGGWLTGPEQQQQQQPPQQVGSKYSSGAAGGVGGGGGEVAQSQGGSVLGPSTISSSGTATLAVPTPCVSESLAAVVSAARATRTAALKELDLEEGAGPPEDSSSGGGGSKSTGSGGRFLPFSVAGPVMRAPWQVRTTTTTNAPPAVVAAATAEAGGRASAETPRPAACAVGLLLPQPAAIRQPPLVSSQAMPPQQQAQQAQQPESSSSQSTDSCPGPSQGSPPAVQQELRQPREGTQQASPHGASRQQQKAKLMRASASWLAAQQPPAAPAVQQSHLQQQQEQQHEQEQIQERHPLPVGQQRPPSLPANASQLPPCRPLLGAAAPLRSQPQRAPPQTQPQLQPAPLLASTLLQRLQQQAQASNGAGSSGDPAHSLLSQIPISSLHQLSQPRAGPGSGFTAAAAAAASLQAQYPQQQQRRRRPSQQAQQPQHPPAAHVLARELALQWAAEPPSSIPGPPPPLAMQSAEPALPAARPTAGAGEGMQQAPNYSWGTYGEHSWGAGGGSIGLQGSPASTGLQSQQGVKREDPGWPEQGPGSAFAATAKRRRSGGGSGME